MRVSPPMKLKVKVSVDEITAFMEGRNKELAAILRAMRRDVEEKGLELSITEVGKEGKSEAIASCGYLEEKFQECSKRGVGFVTSVEKTRTKQLGAKEKARRKKCDVRSSVAGKNRVFSVALFGDWCEEVALRRGLGPSEGVGRSSRWHRANRNCEVEGQMAVAASKKESVSLSLFMVVNDLEVEEELSTVATTLFCAQGVWMSRWRRDQQKAWREADL